MKTINYFNEKLDKADKEFISDMIGDHLTDMEISPCSFSYEIHVTYEEEEDWWKNMITVFIVTVIWHIWMMEMTLVVGV